MSEEKTAGQLYEEREKRITDAVALRVPDRVPTLLGVGYFPAKYTGITCEPAYYDAKQWKAANRRTIEELAPDCYRASTGATSGLALEALDTLQLVWPGHGAPVDHGHQFVEGEYMKADEYDALLSDPSDFAIRTYLPRVFGTLEPLSQLPPLSGLMFGQAAANLSAALVRPEIRTALESLARAGEAAAKWQTEMGALASEMTELGFPSHAQMNASAPFDNVSDFLRGMRGTMIDMYRLPDKLIEACEMLLGLQLQRAAAAAATGGVRRAFIPLHRGADGFMSLEQFDTFYWPTLKKLMVELVEMGITPCPFFEGDYTTRLERLLELPKGKVLCHFDVTDMSLAKEVLGGHLAIMGNVPSSLLQAGTPEDVEDYCKTLIDVAGRDGGFIMTHRSSIDEAEPANIKAMIEFTHKYGVYG